MNAKSGPAVLFHEVRVTDSRIYDVADIVYLGSDKKSRPPNNWGSA